MDFNIKDQISDIDSISTQYWKVEYNSETI